MNWRKSLRSTSEGGNCVEIARAGSHQIATRDSNNPSGPRLSLDRRAFGRLLDEIKKGKYDIR